MTKYLTVAGFVFLLALVGGCPLAQILDGTAFLLVTVGAIALVVSAGDVAGKLFASGIGCLGLAQVLPILHSIAWSVAPAVFAALLLVIGAYVAGVRLWRRLMAEHDGHTVERPKIRARADPVPTWELPEPPAADEAPFDLFSHSRKEH